MLQGLGEGYQNCKKELKLAYNRKRQVQQRRRRAELVALNILCQSKGNKKMAKVFLEKALACENANEAVANSYAGVSAEYDSMTAEERADLSEPTARLKSSAISREAARFLKEHCLFEWVETRNMKQGLAPVTPLVAEAAMAVGCLNPMKASSSYKSQKQWLRRWRKRWGVAMGCIAAREHVPAEEAQQKAFRGWKMSTGDATRCPDI